MRERYICALLGPPLQPAGKPTELSWLISFSIEAVMRRQASLAARSRCVLVLLVLTVVLLLVAENDGVRLAPADAELLHGQQEKSTTESQGSGGGAGGLPPLQEEEDEVRATGSSLPDCSHACGACSPCNRVMVSFKCSVAEPLPCPMVYRCMCRGKRYPVPSS